MKKRALLIFPILLCLAIHVNAQTQIPQKRRVDYPWVPRVSAYEAYIKYKSGKALILHGGGEKWVRRHILAAFNLDFKDREAMLKKLPKEGIEIFTYCY
jgi:hypothetical protein